MGTEGSLFKGKKVTRLSNTNAITISGDVLAISTMSCTNKLGNIKHSRMRERHGTNIVQTSGEADCHVPH